MFDLSLKKSKLLKSIFFRFFDAIVFLFKLNKNNSKIQNTSKVIWLAETGARDFMPRLAQAVALWNEYSIPSIVIHKHYLRKLDKKLIRNSVVIDKSATFNCIRRLRYSKLNGSFNIVIPEELLICDTLESQIKGCLNPKTLNYVDLVACDTNTVKSYLKTIKKNIELVQINNPRLSTSVIEKNCNKYFENNLNIKDFIQEDFLLINDNLCLKFSSCENEFEIMENEVFTATGVNAKEYIRNYLKEEENTEELLISLIKRIREFDNLKKLKIVIRPHPTVDLEKYRNYFYKKLDKSLNFLIIREGTAMEWMKRATLIFHNNCTTAIEGYYFGMKNIFNFSNKLRDGTSKKFTKILNPLGIDNALLKAIEFYESKNLISYNCKSDNMRKIHNDLYKFLGSKMKFQIEKNNITEIICNLEDLDVSAPSPADRWIDAKRKIEYIINKREFFSNLKIYPLGKVGVLIGNSF